ncbi:hypothetical protein WMF28_35340 [Sorangium sp. So ce590]|uniref:hypothetical protein n=1 Tax=Sorangium sp. So ce590 TaxID=3133317 RepID=UPI003F61798E
MGPLAAELPAGAFSVVEVGFAVGALRVSGVAPVLVGVWGDVVFFGVASFVGALTLASFALGAGRPGAGELVFCWPGAARGVVFWRAPAVDPVEGRLSPGPVWIAPILGFGETAPWGAPLPGVVGAACGRAVGSDGAPLPGVVGAACGRAVGSDGAPLPGVVGAACGRAVGSDGVPLPGVVGAACGRAVGSDGAPLPGVVGAACGRAVGSDGAPLPGVVGAACGRAAGSDGAPLPGVVGAACGRAAGSDGAPLPGVVGAACGRAVGSDGAPLPGVVGAACGRAAGSDGAPLPGVVGAACGRAVGSDGASVTGVVGALRGRPEGADPAGFPGVAFWLRGTSIGDTRGPGAEGCETGETGVLVGARPALCPPAAADVLPEAFPVVACGAGLGVAAGEFGGGVALRVNGSQPEVALVVWVVAWFVALGADDSPGAMASLAVGCAKLPALFDEPRSADRISRDCEDERRCDGMPND